MNSFCYYEIDRLSWIGRTSFLVTGVCGNYSETSTSVLYRGSCSISISLSLNYYNHSYYTFRRDLVMKVLRELDPTGVNDRRGRRLKRRVYRCKVQQCIIINCKLNELNIIAGAKFPVAYRRL